MIASTHQPTGGRHAGFPKLAICLGLGWSIAAALAGSESVGPRGFAAFKVIEERNIFAPKSSNPAKSPSEPPKPVVRQSLTLVGTLASQKGTFAFFNGSDSGFEKVLAVGESVAGCTVRLIAFDHVLVSIGDRDWVLPVGEQLVREDTAPWRLAVEDAVDHPLTAASIGNMSSQVAAFSPSPSKLTQAAAARFQEEARKAEKRLSKLYSAKNLDPKRLKQLTKARDGFIEKKPSKSSKHGKGRAD